MIQTILIVESPNDVAFYKKLLSSLNINDNLSQVDIIEFEDLHNFDYDGKNQRGYSLKCLKAKLDNVKRDLEKPNYLSVKHIAVVVDVDFPSNKETNKRQDGGKDNRLFQISTAINEVFNISLDFEKTGEGIPIKTSITLEEDSPIDSFFFSCFLTKNSQNEGNLDYLLKDLASQKDKAYHANCLNSWQDCLKSNNKEIKDGFLTKLWVDYYIRFDTSTSDEKSDAENKLKFPVVIDSKGTKIFNFDSEILIPFKDYLSKIYYNDF
jgi:hypothetical protein